MAETCPFVPVSVTIVGGHRLDGKCRASAVRHTHFSCLCLVLCYPVSYDLDMAKSQRAFWSVNIGTFVLFCSLADCLGHVCADVGCVNVWMQLL